MIPGSSRSVVWGRNSRTGVLPHLQGIFELKATVEKRLYTLAGFWGQMYVVKKVLNSSRSTYGKGMVQRWQLCQTNDRTRLHIWPFLKLNCSCEVCHERPFSDFCLL